MKKKFDKNDIKLAAFDVDGTIFHDGRISKAVASALVKLHERGIITVLATGRMHYYAPKSIMDLGIFRYGAFGNGVIIWDFDKNEPMAGHHFERKTAEDVLKRLSGFTEAYFADFATDNCLTARHLELLREEIKLEVSADGRESIEHFKTYENLIEHVSKLGEPVYKIGGWFDTVEACTQVSEKMRSLFDIEVSTTEGKNIIITPKGANKASGVKKLCEHLGLEMSNVVAFGDGGNDKEMLEAAGFGVALGNGHEWAIAAADYVTKPVWEDGVAVAIKELFGC